VTSKKQASKRVGRPLLAEDDPTISIGCRLPGSMVAELDTLRGDRTRQEAIREAVTLWLRREKRRQP
jgi:Arc/MetJ-type ribon-helix-helix transcriptional regulator